MRNEVKVKGIDCLKNQIRTEPPSRALKPVYDFFKNVYNKY
jgi:hypothetical protein